MKKHFWQILTALLLVCLTAGVAAACRDDKEPDPNPADKTYTVTYVGGDGATGTAPTEPSHKAGETFTVAGQGTLEKADHSFAGWNDGTADYLSGATYTMPAKNVTFTANWSNIADNYTIRFLIDEDGVGGNEPTILTALTISVEAGDAIGTLPTAESSDILAEAIPYGKALSGWSATNGGTAIDATWIPTESTDLYAILTEGTKLTLAYNAGEGSGSQTAEATPTEHFGSDSWVLLPESNFTAPSGKVFGYWTVGADDEVHNYAATAYADLRDLDDYAVENVTTLTAHWLTQAELDAITHKVTLQDAAENPTQTDGESIKGVSGEDYANATFLFPACSFTAPEGKEFDYWDYMGVHYQAGDRAELQGTDVTATACWKTAATPTPPSEKYNLTWEAGMAGYTPAEGVEGIPAAAEYEEGASITIPADPTLEGYVFDGWLAKLFIHNQDSEDPTEGSWDSLLGNNSGSTYLFFHDITGKTSENYTLSSTLTMPGEAVHMVAQWKATYTITYNFGEGYAGSTQPYEPQKALEYSTPTLKEAPVWEGHHFICWEDSFGISYQAGGTLSQIFQNTTLTAVWTEKEQFTITFKVKGETLKTITVNPGETLAGKELPTDADVEAKLDPDVDTFAGWTYNEETVNFETWLPRDDAEIVASITTYTEPEGVEYPNVILYAGEIENAEEYKIPQTAQYLRYDNMFAVWKVKVPTSNPFTVNSEKTLKGVYGYGYEAVYSDEPEYPPIGDPNRPEDGAPYYKPIKIDLSEEAEFGWFALNKLSQDEFSLPNPVKIYAEIDNPTPVEPEEDPTYTVKFWQDKDQYEGQPADTLTYTCADEATITDDAEHILAAIAKKYYTFDGWYVATEGGETPYDTTFVPSDHNTDHVINVYAKWTQVESLPSDVQTASPEAPITIGADGNTSPAPGTNGEGGTKVQWTGKIEKGYHYTYSGTQTSDAGDNAFSIDTYIWSGLTRNGFFRIDRFIADDNWSDGMGLNHYGPKENWVMTKGNVTDFDTFKTALNGTFSIDIDWTDESTIWIVMEITATAGEGTGHYQGFYTIVAANAATPLKDEYSIGFAAEKAQAKITSITKDQVAVSKDFGKPTISDNQTNPVLGTEDAVLGYTNQTPAWIGKSFKQGEEITLTGTIKGGVDKDSVQHSYFVPIAYLMSGKFNYSSFRLDGCMLFSDHRFEGITAAVSAGITNADTNYAGGGAEADTDFLNAMKEGGVNFTLTYNWEEAGKITITAVFSKDTMTRTTTYTLTPTADSFFHDEYYIGLGGENIYLQVSSIAYPAAD